MQNDPGTPDGMRRVITGLPGYLFGDMRLTTMLAGRLTALVTTKFRGMCGHAFMWPQSGQWLVVTEVTRMKLSQLTAQDADACGFASVKEFLEQWRDWHPILSQMPDDDSPDAPGASLSYRVVERIPNPKDPKHPTPIMEEVIPEGSSKPVPETVVLRDTVVTLIRFQKATPLELEQIAAFRGAQSKRSSRFDLTTKQLMAQQQERGCNGTTDL